MDPSTGVGPTSIDRAVFEAGWVPTYPGQSEARVGQSDREQGEPNRPFPQKRGFRIIDRAPQLHLVTASLGAFGTSHLYIQLLSQLATSSPDCDGMLHLQPTRESVSSHYPPSQSSHVMSKQRDGLLQMLRSAAPLEFFFAAARPGEGCAEGLGLEGYTFMYVADQHLQLLFPAEKFV